MNFIIAGHLPNKGRTDPDSVIVEDYFHNVTWKNLKLIAFRLCNVVWSLLPRESVSARIVFSNGYV
jgi:hypothetical protein